jgi:membrane protease YdiL (CAAX protease family)
MNYDNYNPFEHDYYRESMCKEARRAFSRFHLAIFAYLGIANAVAVIFEIALVAFLGESAAMNLLSNVYVRWLFGVGPMYFIGLPVLYLIVRKMPKCKPQKGDISLGSFCVFFLIAQAMMYVGNMIGNMFNSIFSAFRGNEVSNTTADLVTDSPIWITVLVAVIIGPIIEEFIFRKLMIDRLARYGTNVAIIVSGISFGLFHGNFYQFFYSAMLGILLGFITVKTGNWLYSVLMHMLVNRFGSVLTMPVINAILEYEEGMYILAEGGEVNMRSFLISMMIVFSYSVIQYAFLISGVVLFILGVVKYKWFTLKSRAEVNIPRDDVFSVVFANAGTLIYFIFSIIIFALSIALG